MSSYNHAWYPSDTQINLPQQAPNSFDAFSSYQFGTSNTQASQSPNDDYQLSPFDTLAPSNMAHCQMEFFEGLQRIEEPKPNTGLKLGYKRASTACKQCRHRKIRCIASASDPRGRCVNCVRLKKDCSSYLTSQSSADGADPKRVARTSPTPDERLKVTDLSEPRLNILQNSEGSNQPFDPSTAWTATSAAPMPWTDSFSSGSATLGPVSLNVRSHSLPTWNTPSMNRNLFENAGDFDFAQEIQLLEGMSSQLSNHPPVSRPSDTLSQGDTNFLWHSNTYSQPMRPMQGVSGSTNIDDMIIGGGEAGFGVHAGLSTNQLYPPTVNYTSQGRSQSLPYTGYSSNGCME